MRSVSQKRARRMYTDLQSASGLGRINFRLADSGLDRSTSELALLGIEILAVGSVSEVDPVVLRKLVEDLLPEIVGCRSPFARIAEITKRENHAVFRNRHPNDWSQVHVANEKA